jgi:flagellum-specific ATP synthase
LAEYYRDQGKNVLLMMDSVTRYALAQREIGLSAGEPPATRGYPPSVFAMLPRLLERSGRNERGSITAFYTVLVEGMMRTSRSRILSAGILDGHVMLSRKLAHRGHWPAIDVLASVSRSMKDIVTPEHRAASEKLKQLLAAYREAEDMIAIGAYQSGSNPLVDQAVTMQDAIRSFLTQSIEETSNSKLAIDKLFELDRFRAALPSRRTP